ncbi:MAG: DNA-protecting protein DprA, partial [Clostridia bacterium]|nr:DNA-protecting protein DprA [Clostridia bacterium]
MIKADNSLRNLIRISCAFGAGSNKAVKIANKLNDEGLLDLSPDEALKSAVLDASLNNRVAAVSLSQVNSILSDCEREDISVMTLFDERYPARLKNINTPPLLLYVKGVLPDIDNSPVFCIVGPRRISEFGRRAAFSLSRRLSKAGMTVVAGAASGGDTAVHSGAIEAKAASVMITADGILTKAKSGSHGLFKQVLERGCVISENPPRYVANRISFPIRNRIMSGISIGVAVVEAPTVSGALITATHAAEQGRDVFVIPGRPADKYYAGSNALLRDGATPLLDASDIFTRYIPDFPEIIDVEKAFSEEKKGATQKTSKKSTEVLSKEALLVYNNLVKPEFTVDDLSNIDIDGAALLSALTELEMEHLISALPGG